MLVPIVEIRVQVLIHELGLYNEFNRHRASSLLRI